MQKRTISTLALLVAYLAWAAPVGAEGLLTAAERAVERTSSQAVAPVAAPFENPNKGTAMILGGVGAGLVILGLVHKTGIECKVTDTGGKCGQTTNKGLVIAGLAAGAAAGVVYKKGQRNAPSVVLGPSLLGVQHTIRF